MFKQTVYHTYKRIRTLQTDKIMALPIVILMPHSACNCRCVMCDIWKDNKDLKQLSEKDVTGLLSSLRKLGTKQIVMSGGEALLNSNFFRLCSIFQKEGMSVTLLSTGLTLKKNADEIIQYVKDVIISLDGPEQVHDRIRNIPGAFSKLREGVQYLKFLYPDYKVTGRAVIHKLNYSTWEKIIESAKEIGLDHISFLPADVSSQAFNRAIEWNEERKDEVRIPKDELNRLKQKIEYIISAFKREFDSGFISESPEKVMKIFTYYSALYGLNSFPYKKCNAPWVSAVIEPDGTVKPCFFQPSMGNIREGEFEDILNSKVSIAFRKELKGVKNDICEKCVCYLNLSPIVNPGII